ncbi:DUF5305 domain-containing protein [Saliphagus sp. GCM10025308]
MTNTPRLDLLIARSGRPILIALLVIGTIALLATGWVVANPSTTTTTQEVDRQTVSTQVGTEAVVVQDGLWEAGTVLEDNPAYVINASPELEIVAETAVPSDETSLEHEIVLRYAASRNGEVFWESERVLAAEEPTVTDGQGVTRASVDIREVQDRREELRTRLDGVGTVDLSLIVRTSYDTGTHVGEHAPSTPFVVTERSYYLEDHPEESDPNPVTQTVETTDPPSSALIGALLILTVGSFGGAAFVNSRSDVDVDRARQAIHENRYAEWISRGSLPMWIGDEHVSLDTLEDVVDVAIDTNERVIHDGSRGLFAVVSDGVVYYYSDRGLWEETAWPDFDLEERPTPGDVVSPGEGDGPGARPADSGPKPPFEDLPDPEDDDAWNNL